MRTGVATVPLDYGRCPKWLFERMKRLSRGIFLAIREEFGPDEILKRLSDPVWFQSLGCVIGFDWNSSGLTTTTMGALKEGLKGLESDLGIFICGGKGKTSRKTPQQIQGWGEFLKYPQDKIDELIYASRIAAKIDSSLLQDNYQIYHHNFVFSKSGKWAVIQQGMWEENSTARRYHWFSGNLKRIKDENKRDFIEEPHSGIISDLKVEPLNLIARESKQNRQISVQLVKEEPKTFLKDIALISEKSNSLMKQRRLQINCNISLSSATSLSDFAELELNDVEFHWHPVVREKFDLKRLAKTIFFAKDQDPQNFEQLLALQGIGPKTIRALSLVAEIIYGAEPSYKDPARYSFAHGGKDGTPLPVDRATFDKTIEILERGIEKSKISIREKAEARKRLKNKFQLKKV